MSGGEQQRIGFARLLVMKPDIVIMDEATAALDAASQDSMMELFREELGHVTLISVGHRTELEDYHDRKLTLHRLASRVEMAAGENIRHATWLSWPATPRLARKNSGHPLIHEFRSKS